MLKNCIFIGPVIPCDALYCLASGLITQLCLEKFDIFQKMSFIIFDGCLQPCILVNILKVYIR